MNPRKVVNFFKSKTGQVTAFGLLFFAGACLLTGVLYFRHGTTTATPVKPNLDKTADKSQQPTSWFSHTPDADYANKHPDDAGDGGMAPNKAPVAPAALPISLYHGDNTQEAEVSDTYAPYGRMADYYTSLVKEHPDRAVRSFMLGKMFRHEAEMRQTARQAPQAKEWLDQQEPSLKQRIMDRLEKINPFYREKALVREITREKTKIDFTQKPSLGQGMSV
jgi:hypothetical protein